MRPRKTLKRHLVSQNVLCRGVVESLFLQKDRGTEEVMLSVKDSAFACTQNENGKKRVLGLAHPDS